MMNKKWWFGIILLAVVSIAVAQKKDQIVNGVEWLDTDGNVINAHGGGMLKVGDYYYWIGENRRNDIFVSCYRSKDLTNWEFRGDLLTRNSHPELDKANIERPKVIYNEKTGKFVMWMHYEYGGNYDKARAAVAWSDDIEKPFTYLKSFRPFGNMSRDCTLYKDTDGTAYFLSSARENYDLILYSLTDDYLDAKKQIITLWPGGHREAPAIVKRGGYYFLITSGCTGWDPNQGLYAFSKSLTDSWSELKKIGDDKTFHTQPTYILPIEEKKETSYLYVGDRWNSRRYFNSKYIFFPLSFPNDTTMSLENVEKIKIDLKKGEIKEL